MFDGIKRHLAEKQADKTLRMVKDGIDSLSELPRPHKYFAQSGLTSVHDGLVGQLGPFNGWDRKTRTAAMSQLVSAVSEVQSTNPRNIGEEAAVYGSFGVQMLIFYYDSMDLPSPKAEEIRRIIEGWFDFRP